MLGIIGGSGVYQLEAMTDAVWHDVDTPFGKPSDAVLVGLIGGVRVAFLPRHGRGHRIPPGDINVRANISALKQLGVTDVISLSAVGSLRENLAPGTFVVVDQLIDLTKGRISSFFSTGHVGHVSLAHPYCGRLQDAVMVAAEKVGGPCERGGTYVCMEGPQFSTQAESNLYRQWGAHVIGMTACPEAKLAREAELCFSTVAMVTDFDCWHQDHDAVTASKVVETLAENASRARALVAGIIPLLAEHPARCPQGCDHALEGAMLTAPASRDAQRLRAFSQAGLRGDAVATNPEDPHALKPFIRTVSDFPKKGIEFRDVTTLLEDAHGFRTAIDALRERYRGQNITKVAGIDARGFIFGGALAHALGIGFAPVRKKGKLPGGCIREEYALEYGTDAVEMRTGGLSESDRVVIVDDLIATGGTAAAAIRLVRRLGASVVECAFVVELPELKGRARLEALHAPVHSLVKYGGH